MTQETAPLQIIPRRMLYTMIRVGNLERSVRFYTEMLGMHEIRRETFTEGRFTLVFMGYGNGENEALIELTYNWDVKRYVHGTGFGHIAFEVGDVFSACARLEKLGVNISRNPGPMSYAVDETGHRENIAFVVDPDGYLIELVQAQNEPVRSGL